MLSYNTAIKKLIITINSYFEVLQETNFCDDTKALEHHWMKLREILKSYQKIKVI